MNAQFIEIHALRDKSWEILITPKNEISLIPVGTDSRICDIIRLEDFTEDEQVLITQTIEDYKNDRGKLGKEN